ncbi:MAG: hypothetical protein QOF67_3063 [Mycobacterium sp.]|jgi:hypothetical protein|nr:hypothetical protein [Mycobacterium sp.]
MIMAAIPNQSRQRGVAPAMQDLVSDIEHVVTKACRLRRSLEHEPDKQLSALALDDMVHLLAQVKLRLRIDASGNNSR